MFSHLKKEDTNSAPDSKKDASNTFSRFELYRLPESEEKGASACIFYILLTSSSAVLSQQNRALLYIFFTRLKMKRRIYLKLN